ncbi:MAG: PcfJ domain-containing protein, partial [Clostridia bacterium]|nr:PcfJ domain-containing protein [Clostridia bacterium]
VILFVREKSAPKKPFYTLEWRDGRVFQCRTNHNKTYTQDERVKAFVDAWVKHITKKSKKKKESAA